MRRPIGPSSATAPPTGGASVRIPWAVAKDKKGWLEDRRPNANMDPTPSDRSDGDDGLR